MKIGRLVLIGVCLLVADLAAGQVLDEIVVTAQKREQSLQDVPIAISAVDASALENNVVADIYDLQAAVPSLQVQAVDPPGQGTAFALRGLGNGVFNMGFDPAVGTFVDGIYRSRSGLLAASDFLDLERVEVLKGPQGTLFGKNTTAGVIHFISKKPEFDRQYGSAEVGIEENGRYRFKGSINIPASDTAAFRIGANYAKGDGYVDLIGSGEDIHDLNRWAIKAQGLFQPSENLSVHVIADVASVDEKCCYPLRNAIDANSVAANNAAAVAAGSGIVAVPDLEGLVAEGNIPPEYEADDRGLSVEINWDLETMTFTSLTGYRNFEDTANKDNDFSGVDVLRSNQDLPEVSLLSQEFRLAGSKEMASGSLEWLVGGFYSTETIEVTNEFVWGPQIDQFPVFNFPTGPAPAGGLFGNVPGRAFFHRFEQDIDSLGIFAHANIPLSETVGLTVGGRWSRDEKQGSLVSDHPMTNAFGLFNSLPLAVVYDYNVEQDDSEPTYTVSLDYRPVENIMTFLTFSHGYKSGGISMTRDAAGSAVALGDPMLGCPPGFTPLGGPLCGGPMFSPTFEREEADHVELGVKSDLAGGRLRLNGSIWNTDFEDLQTQTLRSDGAFAVVNIEGATSRGAEIEATFAATENADVSFAVQYLDATFEDGLPPLTPAPGFLPLGGENIPFSSEVTANLGLNYTRPLANNDWQFFLGGNVYYRTKYFNFGEPVVGREQDGYALVNLRAGFGNDNWRFAAWCRNCTDEVYTWSNFAIPFDGLLFPNGGTLWSHVAEPRIFGVTASYSF